MTGRIKPTLYPRASRSLHPFRPTASLVSFLPSIPSRLRFLWEGDVIDLPNSSLPPHYPPSHPLKKKTKKKTRLHESVSIAERNINTGIRANGFGARVKIEAKRQWNTCGMQILQLRTGSVPSFAAMAIRSRQLLPYRFYRRNGDAS